MKSHDDTHVNKKVYLWTDQSFLLQTIDFSDNIVMQSNSYQIYQGPHTFLFLKLVGICLILFSR